MAGSLRDQLIKAGLATSDQARKAERQARAEKQAQRRGAGQTGSSSKAPGKDQNKSGPSDPSATASVHARARQLNAEKAERNRALARAANAKAAEKALRAQIRQIILQNDQRVKASNDDDVPYNFVHGKKIKRIYVPRAQQAALSTGNLVIVNNDGRYHLVSQEVAEQIRSRDPKRIIAAHADKPAEPGSDDEYYARFKVPDDLDW